MTKKIVKLAIIRNEETHQCPFGLPILEGCENAGELINKMAPLSILGEDATPEEQQKIKEANHKLYMWQAPGKRCNYAGKIFEKQDAVECNWGSNAPGVVPGDLLGSPFYSKVYNNVALDGIFSYPLGFYADNNISRNLYYGLYSLLGSPSQEEIKKVAQFLQNVDELKDKLTPEDRKVMREASLIYSNNHALLKKGSHLADLDQIEHILASWSELA